MARVSSAFDPVLERPLALKRTLSGAPADDARLLREARLMARLDHPSIAQVLDVGLDASGTLLCVMPVRQGISLAEAVRREPVPALLRALLSASQALAHAHARGVVHRDVSPTNVRLDADGAVWLLDWGLAATFEEAALGGFRGGTPGCMSPELRDGRAAGPASDVWSLGALLHLICTGALPKNEASARPPACPRPLWAVVRKALSFEPAARYADARAFSEELARWLDGQPLVAWPEGPVDTLVRVAGRRPRLTLAVSLAVVVVLSIAVVAGVAVLRAQAREREATSRLLRESAERALAVDDVALARSLATEALVLRDDVRARGVLAALARVPDVTVKPLALPGCVAGDVDEGHVTCAEPGVHVARMADGRVLRARGGTAETLVTLGEERARLGGGTPEVSVDASRTRAVVAVPEGVLVLQAGHLGPALTPCTAGQPVRFARPRGEGALVFCSDDELVFTSSTAVERRVHISGLGTVLRGVHSGALLDDDTLLTGTANGQLGIIDLAAQTLRWAAPSGLGLLHTVVASRDGRSALVAGEKGAALLRVREGQVLPLGSSVSRAWRLGEHGFAVSDGARLSEVLTPAGLSMTRGLHGLSALAVHDGTRRVAAGDSMGSVQVMHFERGVDFTISGLPRVVKSLAFSSDGRFLAIGAAGPDGVLLYDVSQRAPARLKTPWDGDPAVRARHVAFFDVACMIFFGWGAPPRAACVDGDAFAELPLPQLPADVRELAARPGELLLTETPDFVWRVTMTRERQVVASPVPDPRARLVALSSSGRASFSNAPELSAVAIADDGRLASCRLDGTVELRDERGALQFIAAAHQQRCARVSFCDQQRALCTAGWDGAFRVLNAQSSVTWSK